VTIRIKPKKVAGSCPLIVVNRAGPEPPARIDVAVVEPVS
jgi:hypothetical protein